MRFRALDAFLCCFIPFALLLAGSFLDDPEAGAGDSGGEGLYG